MIPFQWLEEANSRIAPHIRKTPLTYDAEHGLYLKWENQQVTGSFKARGALNKVLGLQTWEQQRGLVAASAGNHGQGVALAANLCGARAIIFASEHAVPAKVAAMRSLGAEVRLVPGGYGEAEAIGRAYAAEHEVTWVSPYNDGQVIAGQGTLGVEILAELDAREERPVTWVVPVGGGGLIAGIGVALKAGAGERSTGTTLVGVQSEASPFFHAIFHQGSQAGVIELPSLADGLSGPVEDRSLTIPIVQRYVDDLLLVSEAEIREAMQFAEDHYGERIEGSAATALAAVLSGRLADRPAVLIMSGGNR